MVKERVLVRDNNGIFLKMFRRSFRNEFDFFEDSFILKDESQSNNFDRSIFVVYDKQELIEFLKLNKKGTNVLVCLFNKQLFGSLSFLEEVNNLILLDDSKTRTEIIKELKSHFNNVSGVLSKSVEMNFPTSNILHTQFHNFYKALFFLM